MRPSRPAPYDLSAGLWLDDGHVLLPWHPFDANFDSIAEPEKRPQHRHYIWRNRRCLGGSTVTITRSGYPDHFALNFPLIAGGDIGPEHWEAIFDHLVVIFGVPDERYERWADSRMFPYAEWKFDTIRITHGVYERFVAWCGTRVSLINGWKP